MDQSQDQISKAIFSKYLFLKRILQFVFSVSVLSFFLCCSSGFSIHYPHSFRAYFSTCLLSMFTHTLERKYMFLICNGILAFLAKNSLMVSSPPMSSAFDDNIEFQASNLSETKAPPISGMVVVPLTVEEQVPDQVKMQEEHFEEVSEAEEEFEQEEKDSTLHTETEGRENEAYIGGEEEEVEGSDDEEDKEGGSEGEAVVTQDDEVEDTTMTTNSEEELANTDELNRKFEEFIRKMKEEIRIEAQRQLIAVQ